MALSVGVIDTMFARINMGEIVEAALREVPGHGSDFTTVRRTVPGLKDIPVEVKLLIEREGVSVMVACGWVGGADLDLSNLTGRLAGSDGGAAAYGHARAGSLRT